MTTVDNLVERARRRIFRVGPRELSAIAAGGGLVVDIRPERQRREQGPVPGAIVVERNVLEWRLDPRSAHRLPEVTDLDRVVVVICAQGYASSLAAASLVDLGYHHVGDLVGGYEAWSSWFRGEDRRPPDPATGAARLPGRPGGSPSGLPAWAVDPVATPRRMV